MAECSTELKEEQVETPTKSSKMGKRTDKDFIFGKLIGEGSFSSVYLAKDIHTDTEYAIKTCEKFHIKREKKIDSILREKKVMNILNDNQDKTCPFFVKLYYAFQCNTYLYFVMTYCKNGELLKWIKNVGNFDRKSAAFYSAEILKALEHLHNLNIIHRDLKPENIILDDKMHIKITDFGSAKLLTNNHEDNNRRSSFVGTAQYISPEVLEGRSVSAAADLWALGCVIYQMVSGLPPFNDQSEYLIIRQIQKLEYEIPSGFDTEAQDLVQKLLLLDASKRLGMKDVRRYVSLRNHTFFEGLDFDVLYDQTPPEICLYMPDLEEDTMSWENHTAAGLVPEVLQLIEFGHISTSPSQRSDDCIEKLLRLSGDEFKRRLIEQEKNNEFHQYVDSNLILKQNVLDKRKGLFARRRMFLLTTGPRLFYVDAANKVLKGEVPMSSSIRPDPKNFNNFFLHTTIVIKDNPIYVVYCAHFGGNQNYLPILVPKPNRTYFLEDPNGRSHEWCHALEVVRNFYFPAP